MQTSTSTSQNNYVSLHNHSPYSLLDGFCRIEQSAKYAKSIGQTALAITDHGVMYGAIDFYRACKAEGIKPIIGCEIYMAKPDRTRFQKESEHDRKPRHLVLLCKDETGYQNLSYIVSKAFTEGFYGKPRADMELLREHSEGLVALSACLAGEIPKRILDGDYEGARDYALELDSIFGRDNFYLELQDHGIREQQIVNGALLRIHDETGIPLVCTNDSHYVRPEDAEAHDILLCIQTGKKAHDENRLKYEPRNFYLRSTEEMERLFARYPDALANTVKIADMCNLDFTFGVYHAPEFDVPEGYTAQTYIRELCERGFEDRYGTENKAAHNQLDFELAMIEKMGFTDYFLIVSDFVRYAKGQGIPVGPGRGSAAGSIVSYCLYITDIDPLKYSLYFERFLNPERVSMPDIDMDFGDTRRSEVIDYVRRKYGEDRVAQIVTFGTMGAKNAIRDVGRVMDLPYAQVAPIAKLVPNAPHMTLDLALEQSPDLRAMYSSDPTVRKLIDTAKALEGTPRNASKHAAGVVITKNPVHTYVPLATNEGSVVCQYSMVTLEQLGLLKLDFLALRNLTILDDAIRLVRKHTPEFSMDMISDTDPSVYAMLGQGRTCGVFQMESAGMTGVCVNLKPQSIEDLTAIVALYRPGPMDSIPQFVANKHNPDQIKYKHPLLEPILSITYGCVVYQEQVIEIFRRLAGYSLGQADMVRRAMSKKKVADIEKERGAFLHGDPTRGIKGCEANGIQESVAQEIYDDIYAFANYAFNKAHAVCYAVVAYQTAWFKKHYPKEYMAALLTSVLNSADKVSVYISECKDMGMELHLPDVNHSEADFTVEGDGLRFGLGAIKNIGLPVIAAIVRERQEHGPYADFDDFCERIHGNGLNKRAMESLIYAGVFDSFGVPRSSLIRIMEPLMDSIDRDKKQNLEGQIDLFSMMSAEGSAPQKQKVAYPDLPEFSIEEKLRMERAVTGIYLSGHPMQEYREAVKKAGAVRLSAIQEDYAQESGPTCFTDEQVVAAAGIISAINTRPTKNDTMMAYVTIEDDTGTLDVICFSKALDKYKNLLQEGNAILVIGKLSARDERNPQIIADRITKLQKPRAGFELGYSTDACASGNVPVVGAPDWPSGDGFTCNVLWIRLPSAQGKEFEQLKQIVSAHPGKTPVRVTFTDSGKRMGGVSCMPAMSLLKELTDTFGAENIAIR